MFFDILLMFMKYLVICLKIITVIISKICEICWGQLCYILSQPKCGSCGQAHNNLQTSVNNAWYHLSVFNPKHAGTELSWFN